MANDFLPFAGSGGANVLTQASYAALSARTAGFSSGLAKSPELNKVWRQASLMSAAVAQAVADLTGSDMIDDGTTAVLTANIKAAFKGRMIGIPQVFTASGTYNKSSSIVNRLRIRLWAAGGQGGGVQATSASQVATGGGGSAGSYAEAWFDVSVTSSATVVIGLGGNSAATGTNGAAGGNSSITIGGNSMTCPGGPGGTVGAATSSLPNEGGQGAAFSAAPTHIGALSFVSTAGGGATSGINLSLASAMPGKGGDAQIGYNRSIGGASGNSVGFASGGPGARSLISSSANNGFFGGNGLAIIEEWVL